jgi:ribonuclease BN (tRNA processing enzyme)
MSTELVLLGTAGGPMPVAGRAGISSALVVDQRVLVIDCGRGVSSAFADRGLDFRQLEAVFLSHFHADHTGDLPGLLIYPWGIRNGPDGPLPPVRVYGPSRADALPVGDGAFRRETTIHPELPAPGTRDLVERILAAYAYHLNVMPLDARMPDPGQLVRAFDVRVKPPRTAAADGEPILVFADDTIRVTAVPVHHGHAIPAVAYRFDTPHGSVVFSGDTAVDENLIALAAGADILVHQVADLDFLRRHGVTGPDLEHLQGLHTDVTQVGSVAERAAVRELILSHYLPGDPEEITDAEWAERASRGFSGKTIAGHDGLRRVLTRVSS